MATGHDAAKVQGRERFEVVDRCAYVSERRGPSAASERAHPSVLDVPRGPPFGYDGPSEPVHQAFGVPRPPVAAVDKHDHSQTVRAGSARGIRQPQVSYLPALLSVAVAGTFHA
jgi:hypothetical protein